MPREKEIVCQVDLGNSDFNAILALPNGTRQEFLMPHDILILDESEWATKSRRAKVQRARVDQSQAFQIMVDDKLHAVMIGEEARQSPDSHKKVGSNKYEYGYMDALLCAMLLEMFPYRDYPKGHDNIILGIGYPTTEINHLERLVDIVGGVHKIIDLRGNKRKFVVRQVIPTDEALGGLLRYKELEGKYNYFDMNAGDQMLWLDIGGSIGSMGVVTMNDKGNLIPLYREVHAINQGILNTFDRLADSLKFHHTEEFRGMAIPHNMLKEALLTGEIRLSGGETIIDAKKAIRDACTILDEIDRIYKNYFSSGRAAQGIIMTGGGSGALHNLITFILNHPNARLADDSSTINFANVRGGLVATLAALIEDGLLPEHYQEAYYAT